MSWSRFPLKNWPIRWSIRRARSDSAWKVVRRRFPLLFLWPLFPSSSFHAAMFTIPALWSCAAAAALEQQLRFNSFLHVCSWRTTTLMFPPFTRSVLSWHCHWRSNATDADDALVASSPPKMCGGGLAVEVLLTRVTEGRATFKSVTGRNPRSTIHEVRWWSTNVCAWSREIYPHSSVNEGCLFMKYSSIYFNWYI